MKKVIVKSEKEIYTNAEKLVYYSSRIEKLRNTISWMEARVEELQLLPPDEYSHADAQNWQSSQDPKTKLGS